MLFARGNAHQPVAMRHVFVRQPKFLGAEQQRYRSDGKFLCDELAPVFQAPQRMFQHAGTNGRGANHQRAIGHRFGHGEIFPRLLQHRMSFYRRTGFAEGNRVGIHQAKFGESEIAHGAGGGSEVQRIARGNQDDFERAHGVFN